MEKITYSDLNKLRESFVYNLENIQGRKVTKEEYKLISEALVGTFKSYNRELKPLTQIKERTMKKSEKTVNDYIAILETQYNLLFDYMWSNGSIPYMKYLKDRKILNNKNYYKYTTRLKRRE